MNLSRILDLSDSSSRKLFLTSALIICFNGANAQERSTELEKPTLLRSTNGELIDTPYFSIPTVADIDRDGKTDLIVGQFMNCQRPDGGSAGSVKWYRNESKDNDLTTYALGVDLKSETGLVYADNW